jgi:hypothetical protein
MSNTAIADHALLSDRHSTALVDRSGSVEWLSFPRFDSPSVFGRLLGADAGALEHQAERGLDQLPPVRGPDTGAGDHIHYGNRCARADGPARPLGRTMADIGSARMSRTS